MKFFKIVALVVFFKSYAHADSVVADIIQPLINRCTQFTSGNAQIKLDPGGYSVWEGGRHNYFYQCYIPGPSIKSIKPMDTVLESGFSKVGDATNSPASDNDPSANVSECSGSVIILDSRALGEKLNIAGVPFELIYFSNRANGYFGDSTIAVPIDGGAPNVTGVQVTGTFADGQQINQTFANIPGQKFYFQWNNLDSNGNYIIGSTDLDFKIIYTMYGKQIPVSYTKKIGGWKVSYLRMGGWQPSIYHYYDFKRGLLVRATSEYEKIAPLQKGNEYWVPSNEVSEIYVFDSTGRHLRTIYGLTGQNKFVFNHDSSGFLNSITDENNQITVFNRDATTKNVLSIISPKGQTTNLDYSKTNLLVAMTDPVGNTHRMTYKGNSGLLETFLKPEGEKSIFTYSQNGLLVKDEHSGGFLSTLLQQTDHTWYSIKRVIKESAVGRKVIREIQNSLTTVGESHSSTQYPDGTNERDRVGTTVTSSSQWGTNNSILTSYRKDPRFENGKYTARVSEIIKGKYYLEDTLKQVTLLNNDPFDIQTLNIKTKNGNDTKESIYTGSTKVWQSTSANGITNSLQINNNEKPIKTQIGNFLPVEYSYNSDGTIRQIVQGDRKSVFEYDQFGYLRQVTNPMGQIISYQRDAMGKLISVTNFDGRKTEYIYDKNERTTKLILPHGQVHQFSYDANENLSSYIPPWLAQGNTSISYNYDLDRMPTSITLADGRTITTSYQPNQTRIASSTFDEGVINYNYYQGPSNIPSNIAKIDYFNGENIQINRNNLNENKYSSDDYNMYISIGNITSKITYDFDDKFRVSQIGFYGNQSTAPALNYYRYNKDDQTTLAGFEKLSYDTVSGQIKSKELFNSKITYDFDSSYGELQKIDFQYANKSKYVQEFKRDLLGRIIEINAGQPQTILYDKSGRFTGRSDKATGKPLSSYIYDDNGNRIKGEEDGISFTATYDAHDRLISYNSNTFSYNLNGQLQSKVDSALALTSYSFDSLGNLQSVILPNKTIKYTTDGFGRRIIRKENNTITGFYIWHGNLKLAAELNSTGQLLKQYIYSNNDHVPDYMIYQGAFYTFIKDHRGSILGVINSRTGQVMQKLRYSDWGQVLEDTNPGFQPFAFAGGLYDQDTKLLHFGAREYYPEIGRWISKDPIGFNGGDTNLYGYVMNDPVNFVDPEGLVGQSIINTIPTGGGPQGAGGPMVGSGGATGIGISIGIVLPDASSPSMSKGGKQNIKDTGLSNLTDEEISSRARDKSLDPQERRRYQREEKARKNRNKRKRNCS